ncbi:MAG TPA: gephyrin-like molybdotransferase Glp [Solirubrobacterales bacterium]|jgi:molybdopterin molybdotransferase
MSGSPIELAEARGAVLARAAALADEEVALGEALGRRLAEPIVAGAPLQAFDNSAMDGFAVCAADTASATPASPVALEMVGESRAGRPAALTLDRGTAIAISTGAMLPEGADAVVRVEATRRQDGHVLVEAGVRPGSDVRRTGEDVAAGETVVGRGTALGPAELGVIAALGRGTVRCHRRPRVAIVTSGDELAPPGEPLRPGAIHDSNSHSVPALARLAGAEIDSIASAPDEPEATREAIEAALEADVAIVCGGVSVGEHDHVKGAFERLGVEQVFWRLALKPGGPAWFGKRGATLAFGLPGNPVSAMVVFTLLIRPALIALAGGRPEQLRTVAALAEDHEKRPGRAHALRCRLELTPRGWLAHPAPRQGSHILSSMVGADCLALVPTASAGLRAGEPVEVELLDRVSMAS